ncbi:hypothetical protein ACPC54_23305 [Kitasatospora sp. NPDC094028]
MTKPPGWSLDEPFNTDNAIEDLKAAYAHAAHLSRTDDGSADHTAAIAETKRIIRLLSARLRRHRRA